MKSFMLCMCVVTSSLFALDKDMPPQSVIQYRPDAPRNLTSYDSQTRGQMADIDNKIQQIINDREALRAKANAAQTEAKALLEQYQEQINIQQNYQHQMQSMDDNISELVRQKANLANQLKK